MAVPGSGELKLIGIYSEKNESDYTAFNPDGATDISLRGLSDNDFDDSTEVSSGDQDINKNNRTINRPDETAPHKMSEFYSYDHDFTPFSSVIANFSITATAGTGLGGAVTLGGGSLQFGVNPHNGGITGSIEVPTSNKGVLSLAMSDSGDPGSSGTDNSATGFVQQGTPCILTFSSAGASTVHTRFRFIPHTGAANQNVSCSFSLSGDLEDAEDLVTITKATARP